MLWQNSLNNSTGSQGSQGARGAVQHGRKGYWLNYTPGAPAGQETEEIKIMKFIETRR